MGRIAIPMQDGRAAAGARHEGAASFRPVAEGPPG